jgi:hypothetical protein
VSVKPGAKKLGEQPVLTIWQIISTRFCKIRFIKIKNWSLISFHRSLSGILVLQQRVEYGNPSASLFPSSLLNAMRKQLLSTLYKCKKFDAKVLPTVSSILNVSRNVFFWEGRHLTYSLIYFRIISKMKLMMMPLESNCCNLVVT